MSQAGEAASEAAPAITSVLYEVTEIAAAEGQIDRAADSPRVPLSALAPPKSAVHKTARSARGCCGALRAPLTWWSRRSFSVPPELTENVELHRCAWQAAQSPNGRHLAVVTATTVQFRGDVAEYQNVDRSTTLPADPAPHWRAVAWDPTSERVAVASSAGGVTIVSRISRDTPQYPNPAVATAPADPYHAPAGVAWCSTSVVALLSYGGTLTLLDVSGTEGVTVVTSLDLRGQFSSVGGLAYLPGPGVLVVGGGHPTGTALPAAGTPRLRGWRVLPAAPFLAPLDQTPAAGAPDRGVVSGAVAVIQLVLSPGGGALAALDTAGAAHIFRAPSLEPQRYVPSEALSSPFESGFRGVLGAADDHKAVHRFKGVRSVGWWDDEMLLAVHTSNQLAVCAFDGTEVVNVLGAPEEFSSMAVATGGWRRGNAMPCTCIVDCEVESLARKPGEEPPAQTTSDRIVEALFGEGPTAGGAGDAPPLPYTRETVSVSYLQSMTPEDLFRRKVADKEYGTATALAKRFNLCADLVYQSQWEVSDVTEHAVNNFLRKVTDDEYVLAEAARGSPQTAKAATALYQVALARTPRAAPSTPDPQLAAVRRRLQQWVDRVGTYNLVLEWDDDADFDPAAFLRFRDESVVEIAVGLAEAEQFKALKAVAIRHPTEVMPHLLSVLMCAPEYLDPAAFAFLLPKLASSGEVSFGLVGKPWRAVPDWSELALESESTDGGAHRPSTLPGFPARPREGLADEGVGWDFDAGAGSGTLSMETATEWFRSRAMLAEQTGLADVAFATAALGVAHGFVGVEALSLDLQGLCGIVYAASASASGGAAASTLRLADFRAMGPIEKAEALLAGSTLKTFPTDFWKTVRPLLRGASANEGTGGAGAEVGDGSGGTADGSGESILMRVLVHFSSASLGRVHALLKDTAVAKGLLEEIGAEAVAHIALRCVYACGATDELALVEGIHNAVLRTSPKGLSRELGDLEKLVMAARKFERYNGEAVSLETLVQYRDNPELASAFFERFVLRAASAAATAGWDVFLDDLLLLRDIVFREIPLPKVRALHLRCLLLSNDKAAIRSARGFVSDHIGGAPMDDAAVAAAVLDAAQEYFNAANGHNDKLVDLATECLDLVSDDLPGVAAERRLVQSVGFLHRHFKYSVMPLTLRLSSNREDVLRQAMEAKPKGYTQVHDVLSAAVLLGVSGPDSDEDARSVRALVAAAAVAANDYPFACKLCLEYLKPGSPVGVEVAAAVATAAEFKDLRTRATLLSAVLLSARGSELQDLLAAWRLLDLTRDLAEWGVDVATHPSITSCVDALKASDETADAAGEAVGSVKEEGAEAGQAKVPGEVNRAERGVESSAHPFDARVAMPLGLADPPTVPDDPARYLSHLGANLEPFEPRWAWVALRHDLNRASAAAVHPSADTPPSAAAGDADAAETPAPHGVAAAVAALGRRAAGRNDVKAAYACLLALADGTPDGSDSTREAPGGDGGGEASGADAADAVLGGFPTTLGSLALRELFHAIRACSHHPPVANAMRTGKQGPPAVFAAAGSAVLAAARRLAREASVEAPARVKDALARCAALQAQAIDVGSVACLVDLKTGVDVDRFLADSAYRRESLLGIASVPEWYPDAVRLGGLYKIPLHEIAVAYVEGVLAAAGAGTQTPVLWDRFTAQATVAQLQGSAAEAVEALEKQVGPTLEGTNLQAWLFLYQLADAVAPSTAACTPEDGLTPSAHVELLTTLVSHGVAVAYPRLVDGSHAIAELSPYLRSPTTLEHLASVTHLVPWEGGVLGDRLRTEPAFLQAKSLGARVGVEVDRSAVAAAAGRAATLQAILASPDPARFGVAHEFLALFPAEGGDGAADGVDAAGGSWEALCRATAADGTPADCEALATAEILLADNGGVRLARHFALAEPTESALAGLLPPAAALRFQLTSPHAALKSAAVESLRAADPAAASEAGGGLLASVTDEVAELLLAAGLAVGLRGTPALARVLDCVGRRARGGPRGTDAERAAWDVDGLARGLVAAGAWMDAGALLLRAAQVHPSLRSVDTARALLVSRGLLPS